MLFNRRRPEKPADALDWHIDFIAELAKTLRPDVYVELGLYQAELFNRVVPWVKRAFGVDIDPATEGFVRKTPNVRYLHGITSELASVIEAEGVGIDMLFIDADHSAEAVLNDFRMFFPLVNPHGTILMHDTHPGNARLIEPGWCGDAYRAVEELQKDTSEYEMVTIPRSPGLTICRKRRSQLSWMESPGDLSNDAGPG